MSVKHDEGKLRFDLLPPRALEELVGVLTFGANKYSSDGWRTVPDAKRRYIAATLRHVFAWMRGRKRDGESGFHHLAHAACNLFFLFEFDADEEEADPCTK